LRICEASLGSEHPQMGTLLSNLATLYQEQGRYTKPEPLLQRALYICEESLGSEHPDVASPLNGLAVLYHKQGKYAEAEPLYQRALRIREQHLGPEHPLTQMVQMNYAIHLREMERTTKRSGWKRFLD